MIRGFAAGLTLFVVLEALLLAFVAPFVYNVFSGLFPPQDESIGIIAGILAVFGAGYIYTQVALLLSLGLGTFVTAYIEAGKKDWRYRG